MKKWIFSLVSLAALNAQAQLVLFNSGDTISAQAMNENFLYLNGKFPTTTGTSGDVLKSNGAGGSYWAASTAGAGGVTSIIVDTTGYGSPEVTTTNPGGVATISIPMASTPTTTAGLISYSEFSNFITKPSSPNNGDILVFDGAHGNWSKGALSIGVTNSPESFAFTGSGLSYNLNVPMASYTGVTAGLISKTDYDNFNNKIGTTTTPQEGQMLQFTSGSWTPMTLPLFIGQGGNSFMLSGVNQDVAIGTNNNANLQLKTSNVERMRITSDGNVGIGISTPTSKFQVQTTATNTVSDAIVKMEGPIDGSVFQKGYEFKLNAHQTSTGSYAAMIVNVDTTSNTGTGTKKLLDLSTTTVVTGTPYTNSQFAVNDKGFISTDGFMYKLTTALSPVTCAMTPPYTTGTDITSGVAFDFGNSVTYNNLSETIVEVLLDIPTFTPSSTGAVTGIYGVLVSGGTLIEVKAGISVKRLPAGTWNFRLGCITSTAGGITASFGTGGVFGIRRFH